MARSKAFETAESIRKQSPYSTYIWMRPDGESSRPAIFIRTPMRQSVSEKVSELSAGQLAILRDNLESVVRGAVQSTFGMNWDASLLIGHRPLASEQLITAIDPRADKIKDAVIASIDADERNGSLTLLGALHLAEAKAVEIITDLSKNNRRRINGLPPLTSDAFARKLSVVFEGNRASEPIAIVRSLSDAQGAAENWIHATQQEGWIEENWHEMSTGAWARNTFSTNNKCYILTMSLPVDIVHARESEHNYAKPNLAREIDDAVFDYAGVISDAWSRSLHINMDRPGPNLSL